MTTASENQTENETSGVTKAALSGNVLVPDQAPHDRFKRTKEGNGPHYSAAGSDGEASCADGRNAAVYRFASDRKTRDCAGGDSGVHAAWVDRPGADAALLDVDRNFGRGFDFADLDLSFLMATDNSTTINLDESNFDREINSDKPVLVDFWAEWCGPCKLIAPLLDEIAREKADAIKVAKVNVDENQSLSFKYNIRAIPSLLFFKNGQLRDQVTGMTSKKDLVSRLEALA